MEGLPPRTKKTEGNPMYFRSLQVFRGIAAVAVVLFHVNCYLDSLYKAPDTAFRVFTVHFGLGAWFFFSLSGFLMAYMVDTSRDRFFRRRLLRIYPTFWLAVGLTLLAKVALFGGVSNRRLFHAASLLPLGGKAVYPLSVEWTLIYEVFFYCVCAAFATAALHRWFPGFLACWGGAIAVANVGFGHPPVILPSPRQIPFSLFNLLFIMGGLGYYAFKIVDPTVRVRRLLLGVAGAGLLIYYFRNGSEIVGYSGLGLSFTAAILWGALGDRRDSPAPSGSFFEGLGDASYGLYLIHVPIVTCFFVVMTQKTGLRYPTAAGVAATILALVGGWWFGKLDVALQRRLKRRLLQPRPIVGGATPAPYGRRWRRPGFVRTPAEPAAN
jgi:exopolysaccharide production protein ExoZ